MSIVEVKLKNILVNNLEVNNMAEIIIHTDNDKVYNDILELFEKLGNTYCSEHTKMNEPIHKLLCSIKENSLEVNVSVEDEDLTIINIDN